MISIHRAVLYVWAGGGEGFAGRAESRAPPAVAMRTARDAFIALLMAIVRRSRRAEEGGPVSGSRLRR